jgi:hypothetical protein
MIRRIMDAPWTLQESKHKQLLHNILKALYSRAEAGGMTHIYKVKSHSGVKGNDIVDVKAKEAARQVSRGIAGALTQETSNNAPYEGRTWACTKPEAARDDDDNVATHLPYVSSLLDGIKREITPALSGGQAAKQGVHATAWGMAVPLMHRPSNSRMWKDPQIKWGQIMRTMKARWGVLWNQKLAFQYKMAATPNCPLCNRMDSVGHLLGGCDHPVARAMKIARHDESVKLIQKAIALGPLGGYYTVMDAGTERDLPEDVTGKHIPTWLLPPIDANLSPEERQAEETSRRKMRPDIVVIEGLEEKDIRGKSEAAIRSHLDGLKLRLQIKIHVLEVGYCADLNHADKDSDKRKQHEDIVALLRKGGYDVRFADPITLGRCGTIPTSFITLMKDTFGLGMNRAEEYAFKLNRHAVQYVDKMSNHRQMCNHG